MNVLHRREAVLVWAAMAAAVALPRLSWAMPRVVWQSEMGERSMGTNQTAASRPRHRHASTAVWCHLLAAVCLGLPWAEMAPAQGGEEAKPVSFMIPAQPLDRALEAFGAASGLQIFYENRLTVGRVSEEVNGVYAPQAALQRLLSGTGLSARMIANGTISVTAAPGVEESDEPAPDDRAYYGWLQAGMMQVLCANPRTRPGDYHLVLRYWIDAVGRVTRIRLLGSTGDVARDEAIAGTLQSVALPPPGNLPQPVTMAIEPVAPGMPGGCAIAMGSH